MSSHCIECSTELEPWEGQAGPRTYLFTAREIAHGLKLVADGRSYRSAAAEVRVRANRARGGNRRSRSWRSRRRDAVADGQLLANWVDVFAPALLGMELPSRWPERILVDSKEFRIVNGIKAGMSFHVFVAASYEWNRAQRKRFPIVWRMETYPHKTKACWEEFFLSLQGTPGIVVSDMDQAIRKAAAAVFPRKGDPTPDIRMCGYHLKQRLEIALAPIRGQPNHPLWAALEDAFFSPADWAAFRAARLGDRRRGQPAAEGDDEVAGTKRP